ncbi:MAG: DUF2807 domain-containing protein [Bacteroidales bacterium]|nr:DUF2807 domain-containing protein [Bacteroidales bacterium]
MKNIVLSAIIALLACVLVSCKNVNMNYNGMTFNQEYDTTQFVVRNFDFETSFDKLDIDGYSMVTFHVGDQCKVVAKSSEKAFEKAVIIVNEGTLVVERKEKVKIDPIILDITMPILSSMEMEGMGSFGADVLKSDKLSMTVMGSSSINIDSLICNELEIESNGAGDIDVNVNARDNVDVETNGAGKVIMNIISAGKVSIETNGAGDVRAVVKSDIMSLQGNGANKSDITVDVRELIVDANGLAKIDVAGVADVADIKAEGIAKCDRDKLTIRKAE